MINDKVKHDLARHLAAGGFGVAADGCPRCIADGGYVSPAGLPHDHREYVPGCFRCDLTKDELS